jgi:hypothetical protein
MGVMLIFAERNTGGESVKIHVENVESIKRI